MPHLFGSLVVVSPKRSAFHDKSVRFVGGQRRRVVLGCHLKMVSDICDDVRWMFLGLGVLYLIELVVLTCIRSPVSMNILGGKVGGLRGITYLPLNVCVNTFW